MGGVLLRLSNIFPIKDWPKLLGVAGSSLAMHDPPRRPATTEERGEERRDHAQ